MAKPKNPSKSNVPCCPVIDTDGNCNVLDFHYRMVNPQIINDRRVQVEVLLHARLEVCRGDMTLGNLAYSTTLLPGEKVRLFTLDRRSRFSFDSETNLSYRHEQTHEEQYYMTSMSEFMSDLSVTDKGSSRSQTSKEFNSSGSTSGAIETLVLGPSVNVKGSFNGSSTSDFMRELSRHVEASHNASVQATRASSSVSVGEVSSRTRAEGESESHYESTSRVFSNPNRCQAVTYYFYQLNQKQTVKFKIVSIQRRVIDQAANTLVANNAIGKAGAVSVIPTAILANDPKRLEVEEKARISVAAGQKTNFQVANLGTTTAVLTQPIFTVAQPLDNATRKAALEATDKDLMSAGLLDKRTGKVSDEVRKELSFEVTTSLPTPGLMVKGCLDDCVVCDTALMKDIELDLERKRLENALLKKQIELLEKSSEYRCCPVKEVEDEEEG